MPTRCLAILLSSAVTVLLWSSCSSRDSGPEGSNASPSVAAAPRPGPESTDLLKLAASCQDQIDELLRAQTILFESGDAGLRGDSYALLDQVARLATVTCPTVRLEVEGHTDASGDSAANQRLSDERARAVAGYLESRGITAGRLTARGHGASRPRVDNATPEGRARNRRIEFTVRPGG